MCGRLPFRAAQRRVFHLLLTAVPAALLIPGAVAQNTAPAARAGAPSDSLSPYPSSDTDKRPFDKHDFSGLWSRNPAQFKLEPCPECREHGPAPGYGFHGTPPPRTAEGEKKFQLNKPGRGYELGSKEAKEHPEVDIGMRRAVVPALGNDPEARCDPLGLARLVTFSGGGAAMEMVQVKDRIVQRFEWTWDNREIWMDGRKLPKVDDYLPRYNGYSVGKWEGDTLVVTSTGFDDRQWIDQYGYPISDKMVLEERYQRLSPNRLQVKMTITDPVMYTKPWEASPKVWALIPKEAMSIGGWSGLLEDRCIPTDESLFNQFRDKAAGKK
jgi:hypothetical protein